MDKPLPLNPITENRNLIPKSDGRSYIVGKEGFNYRNLSGGGQELFWWIAGDHGNLPWLREVAKLNNFDFDTAIAEIQASGIIEEDPKNTDSVRIVRRVLGKTKRE